MEEFKQVWWQAGLIEGVDWEVVDGEEYLSMSGMKKLRDYYVSIGDMERARKVNQIINPFLKRKGEKRKNA